MIETLRVTASRRFRLAGVTAVMLIGLVAGCSGAADAPDGTDGPTQGSSTSAADDGASGAGDPTQGPSGPTSDSSDASSDEPTTQDPTGSGGGTVEPADVQNPEGAFVKDPDAYADEPEPPASELAVLCNLTSTYLTALAEMGEAEGSMATALVALDDSIRVWAPLVGFHPEMQGDLDHANRVLDLWFEAMNHQDSGDTGAAAVSIEAAVSEIAQVSGPTPDLSAELGC